MGENGGHSSTKMSDKYGGYVGVGNSSFCNHIHN